MKIQAVSRMLANSLSLNLEFKMVKVLSTKKSAAKEPAKAAESKKLIKKVKHVVADKKVEIKKRCAICGEP